MNSFCGSTVLSPFTVTHSESHSSTVPPMLWRRSLAICARRSSALTRRTISLMLMGLTM